MTDAEIHALVSNGKRGKQRIRYWKCQACGSCRTSRYGTPLYWLKTPLIHITMVMTALAEGVDLSACVRIFGHHHQTISRWFARCGLHSQRLHKQAFHQAVEVGHLQLDELVTKVKQDPVHASTNGFLMPTCNMLNYANGGAAGKFLFFTASFVWAVVKPFAPA